MNTSLKSVGAITLFVEDPQRSKSFYQDVFELPAIYEDENAAVFRGKRTASFSDPDGHIWEIAQELLPEAHGS